MQSYLRLFFRLLFLLPAFLPLGLNAQIFSGERQQLAGPPALNQVLTQWEIYRLDPVQIKQYLHENADHASIRLRIGTHDWNLALEPSTVLAPNYTLQVFGDDGLSSTTRSDNRAFKGFEQTKGGMARLTFDTDFIQGFVMEGNERYYLEPLWYYQPDADRNLFLFYAAGNVIRDQETTCIEVAAQEEDQYPLNGKDLNQSSSADLLACYEMELAIASDKSMHTKYGSVTAVENHNIAVINDVQGNYTGSFNHDINIIIVTQFVVTGTDPWTSSTEAGTLLASFASWGNGGGFGVPFDNGELWTNRDFNGSTVGIAYLGGLCNSSKYHCLQDWTTNSELLRCMTSHEIGHNYTASHDPTSGACPPNYIMCPFVTTSNDWSSNSVAQISSYITQKINSGCLTL